MVGLVGIEPTTNRLWADCSNHWATGPKEIFFQVVDHWKMIKNGGRDGIRTHGTQKGFTPLAGEPFQPLRHPSIFMVIYNCILSIFRHKVTKKWRRDRDSNPGWLAPRRFSRPFHSTTLASLHTVYCSNLKNKKAHIQKWLPRLDSNQRPNG